MKEIKELNRVYIKSYAAVGSKLESGGEYSKEFDMIIQDPLCMQKTWEKAESVFLKTAIDKAIEKSGDNAKNIDLIASGDLINQCTGSTYAVRDSGVSYFGVYSACSTICLSTIAGSLFIESGLGNSAVTAASSHFCTAERQYRFPLEYGGQKTPSAQWTATASGALYLTSEPTDIKINSVYIGEVVDYDITDTSNMGAAMAPAAAKTITDYLKKTGRSPKDFDVIFTGDLGSIGSQLLYRLCMLENYDITDVHRDCGKMLYEGTDIDYHAGASGCGCSASILCGYILNRVKNKEVNNILFCATGALHSPLISKQGESIPGICHLLNIKSV
ncbi:MAG: stage V sporulation protein AD [Oscillospiraceae bacterium]|nr:stage V sporulation protein AD [Candidatus Equicaccousia limihippi]